MASIRLVGASVVFPIYDSNTRSLKKHLVSGTTGGRIGGSAGAAVVEALEGIDLTIQDGERVGLIGHNGAGKTTLLRVLAGIYEPCRGSAEIVGQIAPLFDINLGMDPEATGYQNIVLRGMFLGLTRSQIESRIDDIAEFTELGEFLDLPFRTYSAGMKMRLSFAISTSITPDILLLDEGIGAGDAAFAEKARERLTNFVDRAAIIVLASHSRQIIETLCDRVILLERGRIVARGEPKEIFERYRQRIKLTPPSRLLAK